MSTHRMTTYAGLAVVAVAAVGTSPVFAESSEGQAVTATAVTGCVIRFTADGPAIHENSTHICNGASSVRVLSNGDLEISQTSGRPIVSLTVEEDETLATRGILAGGTGGIGTTTVRFFDTRTQTQLRADSPVLRGLYSNIWVTWVQAA
jgi:hypothetical protein